MIYPELRDIQSPDVTPPELPPDPSACAIRFQALIGPQNAPGAEAFAFVAVTPGYLARMSGAIWGRGYLIVERFEWSAVVQAVATLLAECARPTWDEAAAELHRHLPSELGTPSTNGSHA